MMMSIPKAKLKIAAAQVRDSILASIDADPSVRFSGGFEISMEQTIKVAKRRRIRQDRIMRIAAVFAAVIVTSATFLSVNAYARERFFTWVHNVYERQIVLRFFKSTQPVSLDKLNAEWLPEGYSLAEKLEAGDELILLYSSETSQDLVISLMPFNEDTEVGISSDKQIEPESITVDGKSALYLDDADPESDTLILFDEEKGIVITVNGPLSKDEMIKIVQGVK
ncbi:MAG: DUF4367 domain-containing protein [Firmicutes bacterium]|nr:DUF4367 domain-containing protein [Bacillota bacterium]